MGRCKVCDDSMVKIPEGKYKVQFVEYETKVLIAPKAICTFRIIQPGEYLETKLSRHYNVLNHIGRPSINGDFQSGRKSDLVREYFTIFGDNADIDNIDLNKYREIIVIGKVHTVTKSSDKKEIHQALQYSVISELMPIEQDIISADRIEADMDLAVQVDPKPWSPWSGTDE
ncbi:MAG: hypothetical protein R8G33_02615 [Gammaproteobacteria bacterium]|nr:hypothetical protein [Gammaproteobacteria bacterium]